MACCPKGPPHVPAFNLTCDIWFGQFANPPVGPPNLVAVPCLITPGDRVPVASPLLYITYILLPKGTDVARNPRSLALPFGDIIEAPRGTGRFYFVRWVEDVGKGFPNEYRQAYVEACPLWPVPYP